MAILNHKVRGNYFVAGDELCVRSHYSLGGTYKNFYLPFSPRARDGDFLFYNAIDTILPSPFNSIDDIIPTNNL